MPLPAIEHKLSEALTLRVRQPRHNVNGSILMLRQCGDENEVLECIKCYERIVDKYTEVGWADKYDDLFRFDDDADRHRIIRENERPPVYTRPTELLRADDCSFSQCAAVKVVSYKFSLQHELELQIESEVAPSESCIGHTKYISLLLKSGTVCCSRDQRKRCKTNAGDVE